MSDMGIYKITNMVNGKVYIGQSTQLSKRLYNHRNALKNNYHSNHHLQNAYNKYGETFQIEVIMYCDNKEKLDYLERYYISYYDSMNPQKGYNKEDGGNLNKHHSGETKKKISEAQKGKHHSEETRIKMSIKHNNSGYYRVSKRKSSRYKQGFCWRYRWFDENRKRKTLWSTDIKELEKKVKEKGLPWFKIEKEVLNERI